MLLPKSTPRNRRTDRPRKRLTERFWRRYLWEGRRRQQRGLEKLKRDIAMYVYGKKEAK